MKPHSSYKALLRQKGFTAFLVTQFLGALNDNLLKWSITFLAMADMLSGSSGNQALDLERISLAFIVPALIFSGVAGWLADSFSKRRVLIATKAFEIGIMGLAWLTFRIGDLRLQLAVLFLLATQFSFFGPAKYGIVPELVADQDLSRANGLLEMSTFAAILLGSTLAGPLFMAFKQRLDVIALILISLAALGSLCSFGIGTVRQPQARAPFKPTLLWSEIFAGTRAMRAVRSLWISNLGIAFFWFQGALFQLAVVLLGKQLLQLDETGVAGLGMALALGIGVGSVLAGYWSGDKVSLRLVPWGALGMGAASLALGLLGAVHPAVVGLLLFGVGFSAGLFVVPLNALLQQKAAVEAKGRLQAVGNFYSTLGIIAAALALGWLSGSLGLGADRIILLAGLGSFGMAAYFVRKNVQAQAA